MLDVLLRSISMSTPHPHTQNQICFVCLFCCLHPKSTAMVMARQSVHLTTHFPAHTFACNWQQPFLNDSAEGRRMTVRIISWSIYTKVWDLAATPGSAVKLTSVARHFTICATRPVIKFVVRNFYNSHVTWGTKQELRFSLNCGKSFIQLID